MHFHNVIMADYMERKGGQGSLLRKGVDLSDPPNCDKIANIENIKNGILLFKLRVI